MASRAESKAQLRAERIAGEQATAAAAARRRRIIGLGGGLLTVVIVAVVATLVLTSQGGTHAGAAKSADAKTVAAQSRVRTLLAGIPEGSDNVLGDSSAPISIIEYGDLECVVCDAFALGTHARVSDGSAGTGIENAIIAKLVRTGKAKLVYDSLDTATADGVTPNEFVPQQAAAYAAGLQRKAWYFIELFYNEQHPEGSHYVNQSYLDAIAKQVPGLNYAEWRRDSTSAKLAAQVSADNTRGIAVGGGSASTPTVVVQSKTRGAIAAQGIPSLLEVEQAIQDVE